MAQSDTRKMAVFERRYLLKAVILDIQVEFLGCMYMNIYVYTHFQTHDGMDRFGSKEKVKNQQFHQLPHERSR